MLQNSLVPTVGNMLVHEQKLWEQGYTAIAGVDEAGRGPLAGPVVACACILPKGVLFEGVRDSKSVAPQGRKKLADFLTNHSQVHWAVGTVCHEVVDQINILQATFLAMQRAVLQLKANCDFILVDGRDFPRFERSNQVIPGNALIKGDTLSQSIAAASIIAKVHRDALMQAYHEEFPQYGFDRHKGYGTKGHYAAIDMHGLSPIHRKSFLKKIIQHK